MVICTTPPYPLYVYFDLYEDRLAIYLYIGFNNIFRVSFNKICPLLSRLMSHIVSSTDVSPVSLIVCLSFGWRKVFLFHQQLFYPHCCLSVLWLEKGFRHSARTHIYIIKIIHGNLNVYIDFLHLICMCFSYL